MTTSTYLILKPRKVNYAYIYSNTPTVVEITRQTLNNVCFGSTGLTTTGITRKSLRSIKTGPNQFT